MEVDLCFYDDHLKAKGFPVFSLPESTSQQLQEMLWAADNGLMFIRIMRTSISLKLESTFCRSDETVLSELLQPWLDCSYLTSFLGVITDSSISRAFSSRLKRKLSSDLAATGHLRKIQSLIRGGIRRAQTRDWVRLAVMNEMSLQYIWLVWDCQLTSVLAKTHSMRALEVEGDFVTNLWEMTATAAASQML